MTILIVGCGFAGGVYARTLAESGFSVQMIDQRDHIGGNAFDSADENGVRVHKYGPHLFHTNNEAVVDWIKRFGEWDEYKHRVEARLQNGSLVPLPVNRRTIEKVFSVALDDEAAVRAFLTRLGEPVETVRNAAEHLYSNIGRELTDLFFRPYTKKMWGLDLEEMDASVVKRIPIRYDDSDLYFPDDKFQLLPVKGYTAFFESLLDHPLISVSVGTSFEKKMEKNYNHVFNSMPIDEYFDYSLGELPYRSIRFHHSTIQRSENVATSVVNFTDSGPITRETRWHLLPHHEVDFNQLGTLTREEPCDYRENDMERYYPVKTSDGRHFALYEKYKEIAQCRSNITFIGRCGTYQYLDMHQVINQSLTHARKWIANHG